jgi:hypothetical protein
MTIPTSAAYPERSQATTILVLGILSMVTACFPLGIVAWIMGNNELKAIQEGRRPPENRRNCNRRTGVWDREPRAYGFDRHHRRCGRLSGRKQRV